MIFTRAGVFRSIYLVCDNEPFFQDAAIQESVDRVADDRSQVTETLLETLFIARPAAATKGMATEAQRGGAATKLEDGSAASGQRSAFSGQLRIRASG